MMVVIAAVVCVFCGCSKDDDMYNDSDMYTLAEEMGTRSMGGDPGGGVKKKPIVFKHEYGGHLSHPKNIINSTDPAVYGEYDTDTLTVSISNYVGHASICIVQGANVIDSIGTNVAGGFTNNFPLASYTTGVGYEIDVALSDSSTYVGLFDL